MALAGGGGANSTNLFCFGGQCYYYNMKSANSTSAQARCAAAGGNVWGPSSDEEALRVQQYFGLLNNRGGIYWGITRASVAAGWARVDGAALTYTHW
jgi:hypothetical protein